MCSNEVTSSPPRYTWVSEITPQKHPFADGIRTRVLSLMPLPSPYVRALKQSDEAICGHQSSVLWLTWSYAYSCFWRQSSRLMLKGWQAFADVVALVYGMPRLSAQRRLPAEQCLLLAVRQQENSFASSPMSEQLGPLYGSRLRRVSEAETRRLRSPRQGIWCYIRPRRKGFRSMKHSRSVLNALTWHTCCVIGRKTTWMSSLQTMILDILSYQRPLNG